MTTPNPSKKSNPTSDFTEGWSIPTQTTTPQSSRILPAIAVEEKNQSGDLMRASNLAFLRNVYLSAFTWSVVEGLISKTGSSVPLFVLYSLAAIAPIYTCRAKGGKWFLTSIYVQSGALLSPSTTALLQGLLTP